MELRQDMIPSFRIGDRCPRIVDSGTAVDESSVI
jgi:hypothetical protein